MGMLRLCCRFDNGFLKHSIHQSLDRSPEIVCPHPSQTGSKGWLYFSRGIYQDPVHRSPVRIREIVLHYPSQTGSQGWLQVLMFVEFPITNGVSREVQI